MVSELDLAVILGATSVSLVLLEWAFVWFKVGRPILAWTTGAGNSIISGVLQKMSALRTGRGKNPTAIETLADVDQPPAAPPAVAAPAPDVRGTLIAGALGPNVDPKAIAEGLPLLQKLQAGEKLTPEENAKGMQILAHLAKASKEQRAAAGGNNGGAGAPGSPSNESGTGWY